MYVYSMFFFNSVFGRDILTCCRIWAIGVESDVVLDATDSRDPDQSNEDTLYNWVCEKMIENDDGVCASQYLYLYHAPTTILEGISRRRGQLSIGSKKC